MRLAHIIVKGSVQGVGYRNFVRRTASNMPIAGNVRNLDSGDVEVLAQGEIEYVEEFIRRIQSPHFPAHVASVNVNFTDPDPALTVFQII